MSRAKQEATKRAPLDRRTVCRAALGLIDEIGLDAFSMRKLGARVGVEAMSLYNHVADKSALLDGVVAEVFTELEVPDGPIDDWDAELRSLVRELRRVYLRHPNVLPVLGTRPPSGPDVAPMIDRGIAAMQLAGVPETQWVYLLDIFGVFVLGHCLSEVGPQPLGAGEPTVTTDPEARAAAFATAPRVARAYETVRPTFDFDAQFELGLDLLVTGLARATDQPDRS